MTREQLNELGTVILDSCITVHRVLGPGLLESAYVTALAKELQLREIKVRVQVPVKMEYKRAPPGKVYVMDMLVEDEIIPEIKSVDAIEPVFKARLITYLKLAKKPGLFNQF
jgi:GxxExxY protein